MLSDLIELVGVACLAALAFFIWPPLIFGVIGVYLLLTAYGIDHLEVRRRDDA